MLRASERPAQPIDGGPHLRLVQARKSEPRERPRLAVEREGARRLKGDALAGPRFCPTSATGSSAETRAPAAGRTVIQPSAASSSEAGSTVTPVTPSKA